MLPLDRDCYFAIRKTAHEPRPSRGGQRECAASARNRGAVDIAMMGLMRNVRLRVSEAAALIWGEVRHLRGGSGLVRVGGCKGRSNNVPARRGRALRRGA